MLQLCRALEAMQWIIHLLFQVHIYILICLEGNPRHQWIWCNLREWLHLNSPYPPKNENELPPFKETGKPHIQGWMRSSFWRPGRPGSWCGSHALPFPSAPSSLRAYCWLWETLRSDLPHKLHMEVGVVSNCVFWFFCCCWYMNLSELKLMWKF